jgi:putative ABC transport system permease protein
MIRNYFTIAWRNLSKHKLYSAINIVGLAIGMTACIIIMLFVYYERSFDNMHSKNIYRLNEVQKFPGMAASQKVALSMSPMGEALKNDFPEIQNFSRIQWNMKYQITSGEKRLYMPDLFSVDSPFLAMFDFPLIKGDRRTVLQNPKSIVLTESMAKKLFGAEDPMGKIINHYAEDTMSFTVTGIMKDIPSNSQLQFDALTPFSTFYKPWMKDNWGGNWLNTYFQLVPNANIASMEKRFPAFLKKHMPNGEGWKFYELFLLPLREVHANSAEIGLDYINYHKFDKKYTNIFMIIALIVLAIACINFMNLSTARSSERAKEVGVRKSIGAQRFQLGMQFIGETVLLSVLSLLIALVLVFAVLPYIERLSERELRPLFFQHPQLLIGIFIGAIGVGIISGIYPALYLSSFQPSKVLKGAIISRNSKVNFRNVLVVGQFVSAIFLIIATIFVLRQFKYMQHQDPGFVRDQIVTISLDNVTSGKYDLFKELLSANSLIEGVTACRDQLGSHLDQTGVSCRNGNGPRRDLTGTILQVDPDYLNVYKLKLVSGRNFSKEKGANGNEYIVNEGMAKELLKDNPKAPYSSLIGATFGFDSLGKIIGVAKDFNFNSLHYKIENLFLYNQKDWGFGTVSVKINGNKTSQALAFIQSTWKSLYDEHPFEYQFLDDHFKDIYKTDAQITQMVGILAFLSIFICCLGLFGLASYSAERRFKEIGIRKVLGASMTSIVGLLSKHFIKLVIVANAIAWPIAMFSVNRWMQDYAYRSPMSWWVFLLAGIVALIIALATVSLLAMSAAKANPVDSLRAE